MNDDMPIYVQIRNLNFTDSSEGTITANSTKWFSFYLDLPDGYTKGGIIGFYYNVSPNFPGTLYYARVNIGAEKSISLAITNPTNSSISFWGFRDLELILFR